MLRPDPDSPRGFTTFAALTLILLLAGWLRFAALDFGEGKVGARPDEDAIPLTLTAMDRGEVMPSLVLYGGGYFHPLHAFVSVFPEAAQPAAEATITGYESIWAARWWSALLSWVTVLLVYAVGARLEGRRTGLIAALILATSTLAVREAHFAKADAAAAFAAMVFLWAATRPYASDPVRVLVIGAALAFGLSNKASLGLLPGAILAVVIPPGEQGSAPRTSGLRLLWTGLVSFILVLVWNPHWVSDFAVSFDYAQRSLGALSDKSWLPGHEQAGDPWNYHVGVSLRYGMGLVATVLVLPALVYAFFHSRPSRIVAATCLGLWAMLMTSPMVIARFTLPIVPGLALLVALLVVSLVDRLDLPRGRAALLAAVTAIVVLAPLRSSLELVRLLGRQDTRLLASAWIEENLPADARVLIWGAPPGANRDWGGVPLGTRRRLRNVPASEWPRRGVEYVVVHQYPLAYSGETPPTELDGVEPLVAFEPFDRQRIEAPVLEPMDAFYLPLGNFSGFRRPGPEIAIYRAASPKTGDARRPAPREEEPSAALRATP